MEVWLQESFGNDDAEGRLANLLAVRRQAVNDLKGRVVP